MDNHNNNIGEQIRDAVQDAINSQDFSELNSVISRTIGEATDNIAKSLDKANASAREAARRAQKNTRPTQPNNRGSFNQQWVNAPYREQQQQKQQQMQEMIQVRNRYGSAGSIRATGYTMAIIGGVLTASFSIGTIVSGIASMIATEVSVGPIICLFLLLISIGVLVTGVTKVNFANRFKRYMTVIGSRSFCDIKELASRTGKSPSFVLQDVQKMLLKGLFREGNLDTKGTCLMVTTEAYEQYQTAQKQLQQREREEQYIQKVKPADNATITPEVQAVLDEGNAYITKIHASNDAIPGEVISQKISRMELIVRKIFQRVKEHPEVIPDLKKMMDYYLPTTVKLLDAYEDLDKQPIQGENIASSKKDIEKTLDTLNVAFEKLLDSIFKDVAWDVSTDISVLHTILAQEGLTANDFQEKEKTL